MHLDVTAPENDVNHSWWVPRLGGKIDAIPGRTNQTWFKAPAGTYAARCAELCGIQHAVMIGSVDVVPRGRVRALPSTRRDPSAAALGKQEFAGRLPHVPPARQAATSARRSAGNPRSPTAAGSRSLVRNGVAHDAGGRAALDGRADRRALRLHEGARRPVAARAEPVPVPRRLAPPRRRLVAATTDHKRIGILYIWTALVFFAVGGVLALLMRTQLATPNEDFLTRNSYNEVLTIHGTTMIFLVIVPLLAGFATYLVPLMIGARRHGVPAARRALVLALRSSAA